MPFRSQLLLVIGAPRAFWRTLSGKMRRSKACGAIVFLLFILLSGCKVFLNSSLDQKENQTTGTVWSSDFHISPVGKVFRNSSRGQKENQITGTVWSSDFHISPVADIKRLLKNWHTTSDIVIIDESLSGHCAMTNTCAQTLRVLTRENGITLGNCPNELKREFWELYHKNEQFKRVDAFLFTYSSGLSELFMAFGKPLIIIASVRYEVGRLDPAAWENLNENLRNIAMDERNTIAANNRYDLEYLKHFTGLTDIKLLPNICDYVSAVYDRARVEVLIGPSRHSTAGVDLIHGANGLFEALKNWSSSSEHDLKMSVLRDLYPKYEYTDIAKHPAIVIVPYANSVMSVIEYYRMGIPIFAPSLELLTEWQVQHLILDELSWACIHGRCSGPSLVQPHERSPHHGTDPNNLTDYDSMLHWLQFADFYNWPAVQYYDNWEDLFQKIILADLDRIHTTMMIFNAENLEHARMQWLDVLQRALNAGQAQVSAGTWEQALRALYPRIPQSTVDSKC